MKLCLVFEKCRQHRVSSNQEKYIFLVPTSVILRYIVGKVGKFPDPKKIYALIDMPTPMNIKAIEKFNELVVFNRCFIKNYATIIEPIN